MFQKDKGGKPPPSDTLGFSVFSLDAPQKLFESKQRYGYRTAMLPDLEVNLIVSRLISQIRDRQDWRLIVHDPHAVGRLFQRLGKPEEHRCFDFAVQFLKKEARDLPVTEDGVEPFGFGVMKSDKLMPPELVKRLINGAKELEEEVREDDFHPGSNGQGLDLIQPSMYPVVFHHTRAFRHDANPRRPWLFNMGAGEVAHRSIPDPWEDKYQVQMGERAPVDYAVMYQEQDPPSKNPWISAKKKHPQLPLFPWMPEDKEAVLQWLPSDFYVGEGGEAKLLSYINNLHPGKYPELYLTIEQLFSRFVPMFEKVLGLREFEEMHTDKRFDIRNGFNLGRKYGNRNLRASQWPVDLKIPEFSKDMLVPRVDHTYNLRGRRVKVVVKMSSIHLTPERPKYTSGKWHVEGTNHERIAASGIYYYDSENVVDSKLGFRKQCHIRHRDGDKEVASNGLDWEEVAYGLRFGDSMVQQLADVSTPKGRAICFPNSLQHQLQPFELADKSKGGYRKILVFFLIDPNLDSLVLSASRVPPQQKEWWMEAMADVLDLPWDLLNIVGEYMPDLMSRQDAVRVRDEFRRQRGRKPEGKLEIWEEPYSEGTGSDW